MKRRLQASNYKLSNQFKFWWSNLHKSDQADQLKIDGLEANERKISNQLTISEQIKILQSN